MTITNITINTILTAFLLISHSHAWNMEKPTSTHKNPCRAIIPYVEFNLKNLIKEYNAQYNMDNSPLVALAPEILEMILSKIETLHDAIEIALTLRKTCRTFNELPLEHFGKAYQHHDSSTKNTMLITHVPYDPTAYWRQRNKPIILILAGAQDADYCLMHKAINHNDTGMITALFEKKACLNQRSYGNPFFFNAKPESIKVLATHGVDFNQKGKYLPNILWSTILHNPSSELIKLYLDNNVDAEIIANNGNCLLHYLVCHPACAMKDIKDYVKIGALLLNKAPKIINALNDNKQTPIDAAREYNKNELIQNSDYAKANKKLITLLLQHGGKTAKQLRCSKKQDQNLIKQIKKLSYNNYSTKE